MKKLKKLTYFDDPLCKKYIFIYRTWCSTWQWSGPPVEQMEPLWHAMHHHHNLRENSNDVEKHTLSLIDKARCLNGKNIIKFCKT